MLFRSLTFDTCIPQFNPELLRRSFGFRIVACMLLFYELLMQKALLIVQEGAILASQPFTGMAVGPSELVGGCAQTMVSSGA